MDDSNSTFTALRPQLQRIAYRILGSHGDAQAVVDSIAARFRLQSTVRDASIDPTAWLISATSRLALERWRVGESQAGCAEPSPPIATSRIATLMEDILAATRVALEQLEPDARLAFLLHDIFDADLAELALTLGRNEADCLDLVERARQELHRHHHRQVP